MSKSATIEKAQKLASRGNIKEAIEEWQKLLSESQDNGNIHNAIGDLQLKAKLKDDAIASYLAAAEAFKEAGFDLKSIALYKKTIKVEPLRLDIYEKLADIHAERGLVGNAIDDYLKAAKYYVKQDDVRASLDVYRKMADLDPENSDIRIKIAEMCQKEGFEKESVEEFGKVLALYDRKGMTSEAEEIREKILGFDPNYFENQDVSVIEPTSLETPATLDGEMLTGEDSESSGLIGSDFPQESSGTEVDIDFVTPEEVSHPTEEGFPEFETSLSGEVSALDEESSARERIPEGEDEAYVDSIPGPVMEEVSPKKISESAFKGYLTEAEVYFKYGLNSKAIDQLLLVAKLCPDREEPYLKLKEIYVQEGITEKAIEACCALARIFHAKGDKENITETLNELSSLDQDGNYRQKLDEEILAFERMEGASEGEIGRDLSPTAEVESEASVSGVLLDLEGDPNNEVSLGALEQEVLKGENLDFSGEDQLGEEDSGRAKEASELELEPVLEENAGHALEQMEVESSLSQVEALSPDTGTSSMDDLMLDEGVPLPEEIEGSPVGGFDESSFAGVSEEGVERLSAPEVRKEDVPLDLISEENSVSEHNQGAVVETEGEEKYVDLSSILSEELGGQIEGSSGLDDTLLEGAFNELKKEVESTQNEKDLETHYDLGIAYKEMDMIPEAIKEFELASQGGHRFQDAVIMLASCYRSRGAMATAIKTIEDALADTRCKVDKRVPLLYEMAILVDLSGDKRKAGLLYEEVYQAEPEFRDVKKRRCLHETEEAELPASEAKANSESKKNRISYI